jgi:hypothetical protein
MSGINEALNIQIKETEELSIKDYVALIISPVHTTDLINGTIESVYLDSPLPINITITSMNEQLLSLKAFVGAKWFLIRKQPVNSLGEAMTFAAEKIAVNNSVSVMIDGPENPQVRFILRYC